MAWLIRKFLHYYTTRTYARPGSGIAGKKFSRPGRERIVHGGATLAVTLGLLVGLKPGWITSGDDVYASVQQTFSIPESERRHIGVLELNYRDLSREEMEQAQTITEQLRLYLEQLGLFEVIERSSMTSIMDEVEIQDSSVEDTTAGLTHIGEILGVTEMLGGSISKVGSLYSIQIRLIDVMTSGVIEGAFCDVTDLSGVLESGVRQVVQSLGSAVYQKMQNSLDESGHFTFPPDRDRVAVLRLEGRNVSQGVADAVTERLGFFLGRTTFAHVLEREYIEGIMEEIGFQTAQIASEDIDPVVGTSRILGAEKIIAGLVSKTGNSFSLQIRVIAIDSNSIEYETSAVVDTVEEVLLSAVHSVVNQVEEHYQER